MRVLLFLTIFALSLLGTLACESACAAQQKCLPVGLRQRPRQNSLRIQYHCNRSRARYPPRQGCPDDPKIQQLHNHHLPTNAHFDTSTAAHTCDSFITVIHREQNPASKSFANTSRFHLNNADHGRNRWCLRRHRTGNAAGRHTRAGEFTRSF